MIVARVLFFSIIIKFCVSVPRRHLGDDADQDELLSLRSYTVIGNILCVFSGWFFLNKQPPQPSPPPPKKKKKLSKNA